MAPAGDHWPAVAPYQAWAFALFRLSGPRLSSPLDSQPPTPAPSSGQGAGSLGSVARQRPSAAGRPGRHGTPGSGQSGLRRLPGGKRGCSPGEGGSSLPSCPRPGQATRALLYAMWAGRPARDPATEAAESAEWGPWGDPAPSSAGPSPLVPPPRGLLYSSGIGSFSAWRASPAQTKGSRRRGGGRAESRVPAGSGGRVRTRGALWARQEAPSLHGSGGAGRPGLRDLPARRPHALRAGGAARPGLGRPSRRGAGGAGAGGRRRVSTFTTPAGRAVTLYFWDRA